MRKIIIGLAFLAICAGLTQEASAGIFRRRRCCAPCSSGGTVTRPRTVAELEAQLQVLQQVVAGLDLDVINQARVTGALQQATATLQQKVQALENKPAAAPPANRPAN